MSEINITERVLNKLDKIDESIKATELNITEIKGDLKFHMARTLAVEKTNELLVEKIDNDKQVTDTRLEKMEKFFDKFHYVGWLVGGAITLAEILSRMPDLIKFFKSF